MQPIEQWTATVNERARAKGITYPAANLECRDLDPQGYALAMRTSSPRAFAALENCVARFNNAQATKAEARNELGKRAWAEVNRRISPSDRGQEVALFNQVCREKPEFRALANSASTMAPGQSSILPPISVSKAAKMCLEDVSDPDEFHRAVELSYERLNAGQDPDYPALRDGLAAFRAGKDGTSLDAGRQAIDLKHPALARAATGPALGNAGATFPMTPAAAFLRPMTQAAAGEFPNTQVAGCVPGVDSPLVTPRPVPASPATTVRPVLNFTPQQVAALGLTANDDPQEIALAVDANNGTFDPMLAQSNKRGLFATLTGYWMAKADLNMLDAQKRVVSRHSKLTPDNWKPGNFSNF